MNERHTVMQTLVFWTRSVTQDRSVECCLAVPISAVIYCTPATKDWPVGFEQQFMWDSIKTKRRTSVLVALVDPKMVMPGLLFAALVVATSAKNADARAVPSDPLPRDHKQIAAAQFVEEVDSVLNTLYFRPMPDDDESWDKDISSLLQQNQPPTPPEHDLTTTVVAVDEEQVSSSFYLQLSTPTGSPDEIIVDKQTEHMDNSLDKRGVDTSYASSNYISPETPDDSAIAVQTLQQGLEKTAGDVELTKQRVEDLTAEAAKDREELMLLRTEFNKLKANLLSLLTAVLLGQTNTGGTSTMASGVSRRSQDGAWTTRLMSNLRQTL